MFAFEQKCQAKGQKLKLDNIKEWKIVSLLSLDKKKKQPIRFSTLNCCEALRQILFICLSKFSW